LPAVPLGRADWNSAGGMMARSDHLGQITVPDSQGKAGNDKGASGVVEESGRTLCQ